VFRGSYIKDVVDPQIKDAFAPRRAPWGDLRKTWKAEHCARVNPTGYHDDCPYSEEQCALAFLEAVIKVQDAEKPGALFRKIARWEGIVRADNKPLAREGLPERRKVRVDRPRPAWTQLPGVGADAARLVLDADRRPYGLGEVLRGMDLGARQGSPDDGEESPR